MMDSRTLNNASKFVPENDLVKIIRQTEGIIVRALNDAKSPYHCRQIKVDDGKSYMVEYIDLVSIIQDMFVNSISNRIIGAFGSEKIIKPGNYHLFADNNMTLANLEGIRKNKYIEIPIDYARVVGLMMPNVRAAFDKKGRNGYTVDIANLNGRFKGVNIDELVWDHIARPIMALLEDYLEQKYSLSKNSVYFRPEFELIKGIYGIHSETDVFVGGRDRLRKIIVGKMHETCQKNKPTDYNPITIEFLSESGLKKIIRSLTDAYLTLIISEVDKLKSGGNPEHFKSERNYHAFRWGNFIPIFNYKSQLADGLNAWMNGIYFEKNGAFITPSNNVLVMPSQTALNTDNIDDKLMGVISKRLWDFALSYFKRSDMIKFNRVSLHYSCVTSFLMARYDDREGMPKEMMRLDTFCDGIQDLLAKTIEEKLPFPKYDYRTNQAPNQIYKEDNKTLSWKD